MRIQAGDGRPTGIFGGGSNRLDDGEAISQKACWLGKRANDAIERTFTGRSIKIIKIKVK